MHVSTDYVFGGEQHRRYEVGDATNPLGVYGKSKLAGELAVLAAMPDAKVVRTSWVYTGGGGNDFVAVMRRLAATDREIDVVDDQTGSPTYAKDLVNALFEAGEAHPRTDPARRERRRGQPLGTGPGDVRRTRRRS